MTSLLWDRRGVAAIEFSLVAPLMCVVLLGLISVWSAITQADNMHDSVEAAAAYYLRGGSTDSVAQTIAENAWLHKPNDGVVTITRACSCNGAAASCTAICVGANPTPQLHITINETGTWTSPVPVIDTWASTTLAQQEVVRVR
jgi:Flp pilus assembly protein TadG